MSTQLPPDLLEILSLKVESRAVPQTAPVIPSNASFSLFAPAAGTTSHTYDHPTIRHAVSCGRLDASFVRPLDHLPIEDDEEQDPWPWAPREWTDREVRESTGQKLYLYNICVIRDLIW